jgi:hypothetical protein
MKKFCLWGMLLIGVFLMAACQLGRLQPAQPELDFLVSLQGLQNGETEILLEVLSRQGNVPADEEFDGQFTLYAMDGTVLSKAVINGLPELVEGERQELIRIQTLLETGEYIAVWGAPAYGAKIMNLEMVEVGSTSIIEPLFLQSMSVEELPAGFPDIDSWLVP